MTPTTPTPGAEPHQPGERASNADQCRALGWLPGTRLAGDEGYGESVIEITALGEQAIIAKMLSHRGRPERGHEMCWVLDCRDWRVVQPADAALAKVADLLDWLADRREEYVGGPEEIANALRAEVRTARLLAKILRGPHEPDGGAAWSWLPSWRWPEWAAQIAALTPKRGVSAETHTEWGVRYVVDWPNPRYGDDGTRVQKVDTERHARTAVGQEIPRSGHGHTLVRREVTDWREVRGDDQ